LEGVIRNGEPVDGVRFGVLVVESIPLLARGRSRICLYVTFPGRGWWGT
jgi:hypothetical protein